MEGLEIEKKHSPRREEFLYVNLAALYEFSRLNLALISIDR